MEAANLLKMCLQMPICPHEPHGYRAAEERSLLLACSLGLSKKSPWQEHGAELKHRQASWKRTNPAFLPLPQTANERLSYPNCSLSWDGQVPLSLKRQVYGAVFGFALFCKEARKSLYAWDFPALTRLCVRGPPWKTTTHTSCILNQETTVFLRLRTHQRLSWSWF